VGPRNQLPDYELNQPGLRSGLTTTCSAILLWALPIAGGAQSSDPMDVMSKLDFHARNVGSPWALAETAAYAGILQGLDTPREWGLGADSYGKRFASALGGSAIHGALAFGLDSTLHQDPRYYRSGNTGFGRRMAHAFRGTILTRTDSGRETVSTWRLGSAYGAAFLTNEWYPDRVNTVRLGALQGSLHFGFDFVSNIGAEFWPDVKQKLFHRKP